MTRTLSRFSDGPALRAFAFLIVFISGYNLGVPGMSWAVAYQPVRAVFLDNVLLAAYVAMTGIQGRFSKRSDAVVFAGLVAALGGLGMISPAFNPNRAQDVGQALRLLLFGVYVMQIVYWTRRHGETFVLRAFLGGLAVGGALNLYYSFTQPYLHVAMLPALQARNGTGGPLGIGVGLAAWLFVLRRNVGDTLVVISTSLVGIFAALISFSKTSMLIALFGVLAWFLLFLDGVSRRGARVLVGGALTLVALTGYVSQTSWGQDFIDSFRYSLSIKFASASLTTSDNSSTQWRYQYFWGVAEIVSKHPIVGVSSSGFYDAIIATEPFRAGLMGEEDPEARTQGGANPHNSFLYYAAANGIPGFALAVALFAAAVVMFGKSLWPTTVFTRGVIACLAMEYFIYGMTLPSLFNSTVMYVPVAAAIGIAAARRSGERRVLAQLTTTP